VAGNRGDTLGSLPVDRHAPREGPSPKEKSGPREQNSGPPVRKPGGNPPTKKGGQPPARRETFWPVPPFFPGSTVVPCPEKARAPAPPFWPPAFRIFREKLARPAHGCPRKKNWVPAAQQVIGSPSQMRSRPPFWIHRNPGVFPRVAEVPPPHPPWGGSFPAPQHVKPRPPLLKKKPGPPPACPHSGGRPGCFPPPPTFCLGPPNLFFFSAQKPKKLFFSFFCTQGPSPLGGRKLCVRVAKKKKALPGKNQMAGFSRVFRGKKKRSGKGPGDLTGPCPPKVPARSPGRSDPAPPGPPVWGPPVLKFFWPARGGPKRGPLGPEAAPLFLPVTSFRPRAQVERNKKKWAEPRKNATLPAPFFPPLFRAGGKIFLCPPKQRFFFFFLFFFVSTEARRIAPQ